MFDVILFFPSLCLVCDPRTSLNGFLHLSPTTHLIDALFRKVCMTFFRRHGHPVVVPQVFLDFSMGIIRSKKLCMYFTSVHLTMLWQPSILLLAVCIGGLGMR